MQHVVNEFIAEVVENNRSRISPPVYEFGSYQCFGASIEDLRPFFEDMEYHGCDLREGPGVDEIRDVMNSGLEEGSVGVIICAETMEHVTNPIKAFEEMHRILKAGGLLIVTSVFSFPIHDFPHDYFRFTPQAFEMMLEKFSEKEVSVKGGTDDAPKSVFAWAIK